MSGLMWNKGWICEVSNFGGMFVTINITILISKLVHKCILDYGEFIRYMYIHTHICRSVLNIIHKNVQKHSVLWLFCPLVSLLSAIPSLIPKAGNLEQRQRSPQNEELLSNEDRIKAGQLKVSKKMKINSTSWSFDNLAIWQNILEQEHVNIFKICLGGRGKRIRGRKGKKLKKWRKERKKKMWSHSFDDYPSNINP